MSAPDLYILPEEVSIIPVLELNEEARSKFKYEEDDYVITYSSARNTSKVINAVSASLVNEFRTPKSLPEGVFTYSHTRKLNPAKVLDDAYPFLVRLRSEGFLVLYNQETCKKRESILTPGDKFEGFEVISKLPGVNDTEVYKLRKENTFYALKLLKTRNPGSILSKNFNNEVEVLSHLDGAVNPVLIKKGEHETNHYIITEWISGVPCNVYAENFRNTANPQNVVSLLDLCCAILSAYTHLHKQNVIHADIHPNNILVDENRQVSIIDFGLARIVNKESLVPRGGIGFFYEPEFAVAVSQGLKQPAASFKGEQYSLAVLLYSLVVGKEYLNFSYEKDVLFRQIVNDSPIPFSEIDVYINPAIEKIIFKALAKNPEDRFDSVDEFYSELLAVRNSIANKNINIQQKSFSAFSDSLKEKFGLNSRIIETGLQLAPVCSVNYGAAGIAYMFHRMALAESDAQLLAVADIWANKASNYVEPGEKAFYSKDIEITPSTVGKTSIYHTASGTHLVQALISKDLGDFNTHFNAAINFIQAVSQPCENLDLTLGKCASLTGCSMLYKNLLQGNKILKRELLHLGNTLLQEVWNNIDSYSAVGEKSPVAYNGIAHGWAGILYATLTWCITSGQTVPAKFFERVEQLLSIGINKEDYMFWQISNTEKAGWPGWCHGSAGYTFLWTLLYRYTKDELFLETAEKATNHFLSANKDGTLANLCCGKVGEAYALLNLYNTTQNKRYLNTAREIAKAILPHAYSNQMRNNSLYKGDIGLGVLLAEIEIPEFARMPLFEL